MSSGQSSRRKEPRAPLFEVQEKPLRKPPRPIENTLDPFEDLPAVGPRSARRPAPLLRTPDPTSPPAAEERTTAAPALARRANTEPDAQFSRREMLRPPASVRPASYESYPLWEAPITLVRGRPWLLLLAALVCGVTIWMFSQYPKTFISTYGGLGFGNAASNTGTGFNLDTPVGEHSVLSAPTITAATIDSVLSQYNSPAAGTGQMWVTLGQRYGIDPAYALAFFIHESSAGTNPGWAGLKANGASTHNVGNIICAGYATCYGRFRDYASWEEGIDDWYKLISDEYVAGRGAHTVEQIIPVYAPSSDNNNVPAYIQAVVSMVDNWRQGILQ